MFVSVVCAALLLPGLIHAVPAVQFSAATHYTVAGRPVAIACADFNHDGKVDLVTANQVSNSVSVLLGLGGGAFQSPTNFSVGTTPVFVAIGDFNTNGHWDIVTANYNGASVSVLSGNGDGTFGAATNRSAGDRPSSIAIGDFNRDHNPDLAVVNAVASTARILLGNGNGTFVNGTTLPVGSGSLDSIVTDDLNGDGKLDLVTASASSGDVSVLLGNGDGTFGTVSNYLATGSFAGGGNLQSAACGDFDNDSILDLVTANKLDGSSTLLKGRGDGSFLTVATNRVYDSVRFVAVGDFNVDGALDFVAANTSTTLALRLGNGNGTFVTDFYSYVGRSQEHVAVADVNGDGLLDLLTLNGAANSVSVLLNQSIPALRIDPVGNALRISWPNRAGYQFESSTNFGSPWLPRGNLPPAVNGQIVLTNLPSGEQEFYRLKRL